MNLFACSQQSIHVYQNIDGISSDLITYFKQSLETVNDWLWSVDILLHNGMCLTINDWTQDIASFWDWNHYTWQIGLQWGSDRTSCIGGNTSRV